MAEPPNEEAQRERDRRPDGEDGPGVLREQPRDGAREGTPGVDLDGLPCAGASPRDLRAHHGQRVRGVRDEPRVMREVMCFLEAMQPVLEARFDALVEQRTGYPNINGVLKEMRDHKADLLRVLQRSEVPLHNNAMESDIREFVKRRKISGGTRNDAGRRCRDTFASLKKTCRKLGVRFWDYLQDRVRGLGIIPRLADLIRQKARQTATPQSQAVPG